MKFWQVWPDEEEPLAVVLINRGCGDLLKPVVYATLEPALLHSGALCSTCAVLLEGAWIFVALLLIASSL